jgi:hypothetical protein
VGFLGGTAAATILESTARFRPPRSTPVWATTCLTASLIRCGRPDRANRRQYTSVEAANPASSSVTPHATFGRRSRRPPRRSLDPTARGDTQWRALPELVRALRAPAYRRGDRQGRWDRGVSGRDDQLE